MFPAAFAASTRSPTFTSEIALDSPDSRESVSEPAKHAFLPFNLDTIIIATGNPSVGLAVGFGVSTMVTANVGYAVGISVRADVGDAVGAIKIIGVDVGDAVVVDAGNAVGAIEMVGVDVGDAVVVDVGNAVGAMMLFFSLT